MGSLLSNYCVLTLNIEALIIFVFNRYEYLKIENNKLNISFIKYLIKSIHGYLIYKTLYKIACAVMYFCHTAHT